PSGRRRADSTGPGAPAPCASIDRCAPASNGSAGYPPGRSGSGRIPTGSSGGGPSPSPGRRSPAPRQRDRSSLDSRPTGASRFPYGPTFPLIRVQLGRPTNPDEDNHGEAVDPSGLAPRVGPTRAGNQDPDACFHHTP